MIPFYTSVWSLLVTFAGMKKATLHLWPALGTLLYTLFLVKMILLKGRLFFWVVPASRYYKSHMQNRTYHGLNLVPFRTFRIFLSNDVSFASAFFNLAGNVLLFVPFGFLLSLTLRPKERFATILLTTALLSLSFELYQLFSHTGQCDIDDVILNTTGGILGFFAYRLVKVLGRKQPGR